MVCWRFENDDDRNLMASIKRIKRRSATARFSDIILTALSLSLEEHIADVSDSVPKDMTLVNIARFAPEGSD